MMCHAQSSRYTRLLIAISLLGLLLPLLPTRSVAQTPPPALPADYAAVLETLSRKGDYKDNVLKIGIPRSDIAVAVDGIPVPTALGFGGWVALTRGANGRDVLMGDLVLREEEVNPVMSALLDNGLEVTALHNHFFYETPRIFYLHVHGWGAARDLAQKLKPALDLLGKVSVRGAVEGGAVPNFPATPQMNMGRIAEVLGHSGEANGAVYKVTVGRPDIALREMGADINARMGLNTWAAFYGTDDNAVVAGDVAMRENEVTSVLKALRGSGIEVVAIHHHMTGATPMIFFLHYWGKGPAEKLAHSVRAALDQLGLPATPERH